MTVPPAFTSIDDITQHGLFVGVDDDALRRPLAIGDVLKLTLNYRTGASRLQVNDEEEYIIAQGPAGVELELSPAVCLRNPGDVVSLVAIDIESAT